MQATQLASKVSVLIERLLHLLVSIFPSSPPATFLSSPDTPTLIVSLIPHVVVIVCIVVFIQPYKARPLLHYQFQLELEQKLKIKSPMNCQVTAYDNTTLTMWRR